MLFSFVRKHKEIQIKGNILERLHRSHDNHIVTRISWPITSLQLEDTRTNVCASRPYPRSQAYPHSLPSIGIVTELENYGVVDLAKSHI